MNKKLSTITISLIVVVMAFGIVSSSTVLADNKLDITVAKGYDEHGTNVKAIPKWVDNNFKWYAEGKIGQEDLLNSLKFMLDNGLMHLSDKAAKEIQSLKEENQKFRKLLGHELTHTAQQKSGNVAESSGEKLTGSEFVGDVVGAGVSWDDSDPKTGNQALHHLRKAYDLNPNLQTKISQYDASHKKWIDVLSIDWGASTNNGDPDRPIIIGRIASQADSDKGLQETSRQTPKTDFGTMVRAIDTEYKLVSSKIKLLKELSERVPEITDKDMTTLSQIKQELDSIQSKLDSLKPHTAEMDKSFNLQYLSLQQQMQAEAKTYSMLSNIMKTKHDTVKNSISNVR